MKQLLSGMGGLDEVTGTGGLREKSPLWEWKEGQEILGRGKDNEEQGRHQKRAGDLGIWRASLASQIPPQGAARRQHQVCNLWGLVYNKNIGSLILKDREFQNGDQTQRFL